MACRAQREHHGLASHVTGSKSDRALMGHHDVAGLHMRQAVLVEARTERGNLEGMDRDRSRNARGSYPIDAKAVLSDRQNPQVIYYLSVANNTQNGVFTTKVTESVKLLYSLS